MTKAEFLEVCKILEQMGFAVYAVSDPKLESIPDEYRQGVESKKIRKTLVNWDRELRMLVKQGK